MQKEKYRDLEQKINDYFLYCDAFNEASEKLIKPYTLSGLLGYIEITRAEFERLSKIRRHEKILCLAKMKIESFIEENALTGKLSSNASMNSLKYNFGWGEKQDAEEVKTDGTLVFTMSPELLSLAK